MANPNLVRKTDIWYSGANYQVGDVVSYLGYAVMCVTAHTAAASFMTDSQAGYWKMATPTRNHLINGNFDFWQRATSNSGNGGNVGTGFYVADRWRMNVQVGSQSVSQITYNDSLGKYAYRMQITTKGSPFGGYELAQPMEESNSMLLSEKPVTFSIWLKRNATFNTGVININIFASTDTNSSTQPTNRGIYSLNINAASLSTTAFTRVILPVSNLVTSLGAGTTVRNIGVWVRMDDATTPDGSYLEVRSGVLNEGPAPADFTLAGGNMAGEFTMCQRYFEKSWDLGTPVGTATSTGTTGIRGVTSSPIYWVPFKVEKRATPTMTTWDWAGNINRVRQNGVDNVVNATAATAFGVGTAGTLASFSGAATELLFHYTADAEL